MKLILRLVLNACAIYLAVYLIPGIKLSQSDAWWTYIIFGLVLGLLNGLIKPLIKFLTCPLILLTLGLFNLIINTVLLYAANRVSSIFDSGLDIDSFWSALLGAIIISVVNVLFDGLIKDSKKKKKKHKK